MSPTRACAELEILESAFIDSLAGRTRVVAIEGPTGCGKSRLITTIAARGATEGAVLLAAVGSRAERDVPLGVVRQMLDALPEDRLADLYSAGGDFQLLSAREFCSTVEKLSLDAPVICTVDDLQYVDDASLHYLQALVRDVQLRRILVVTAGSRDVSGEAQAAGSQLFPEAVTERLRPSPLSRDEIVEALERYPAIARISSAVDTLLASVGGNHMLFRALLDELNDVRPAPVTVTELAPRSGGRFAEAVLTCVRRIGPAAYAVACALAVLGDLESPDRAAQLLGFPMAAVSQAVASMNSAGILRGNHFGNPSLAQSVADGMEPADQVELHRRYAVLLHGAGGSAADIAEHLLACDLNVESGSEIPWAVEILRERAEQLIAEDNPREAARFLEGAHAACLTPIMRAEIKIRLATVTWRLDPAAAERHLAMPLQMAYAGELSHGRMGVLARLLGAQGRILAARAVSGHILQELEDAGVGNRLITRRDHVILWGVPDHGGVEIADRERFLQTTVLTEHTLLPIVQSLRSLILAEQIERVTAWCQQLTEQARERDAPGWVAVFSTVHGEAVLSLGDLRGAEKYALIAKEALPSTNSVFAGAPQTLLIRARTAMGEHGKVARMLDEMNPQMLSDTVFLPPYLHARGQHLMALGQPSAALCDFLEAGRTLAVWGMDRPLILSWRTEAAEALLRLGDAKQAERLVQQQLAMPEARHPRVRGASLRLRAATSEPGQRHSLLEQSIEELRRSGDRLQMVRSMVDLGNALRTVGETGRASMLNRRAWTLAHACGAKGLQEEILPGAAAQEQLRPMVPRERQGKDNEVKLSDSEQRVATLAAQGYTNREISARLYITVSTVEQHLTRVYRKLSINKRQDLPVDLQLSGVEGI